METSFVQGGALVGNALAYPSETYIAAPLGTGGTVLNVEGTVYLQGSSNDGVSIEGSISTNPYH